MCQTYTNTDDPRFSCTCHLVRNLPEHKHAIRISFDIPVVAWPWERNPACADWDEVTNQVLSYLDSLRSDVRFGTKMLEDYDPDLEEITKGCPCCEAIKADEYEPDVDDLDD